MSPTRFDFCLRWILIGILLLVSLIPFLPSPTGAGWGNSFLYNAPPIFSNWTAADLRILQYLSTYPSQPELQWIAAYSRLTPSYVELRFDLLELSPNSSFTLKLFCRTLGQSKTETVLTFLPDGRFTARSLSGLPLMGFSAHLFREDDQDALIVRISRRGLPAQFYRQTLTAQISSPTISGVHSLAPFNFNQSVEHLAATSLVFWNTLPAATPAQTQRRWDGAHTGPYGQRHGLAILISAASRHHLPLILLDLKQPQSLAGLDVLGMLNQIQQNEMLILPEQLPAEALDDTPAHQLISEIAQNYGLLSSPFCFGPLPASGAPGCKVLFSSPSTRPIPAFTTWNGFRIIPLPQNTPLADQNTTPRYAFEGLPLETRLQLLQSAVYGDASTILPIGGDLPNSFWGDSLFADPGMAYLKNHPWVHVLSAQELLSTFPAKTGEPACDAIFCPPTQPNLLLVNNRGDPYPIHSILDVFNELRRLLSTSAPGPLLDQAWLLINQYSLPNTESRLSSLQANYLGTATLLAATSNWAANPTEISDCSHGLEMDGLQDCILASKEIFLAIEPEGAYISLAVAKIGQHTEQIIGPRSQSSVGLSDPQEWHLQQGSSSDPQEIPGALVDMPEPYSEYIPVVKSGEITFVNPSSSVSKTFSLSTHSFSVMVHSPSTIQSSILLNLAPSRLNSPGWANSYRTTCSADSNSCTWQLTDNLAINVSTKDTRLKLHSFLESLPQLQKPEDPNQSVPPGHFIPFPLAFLEISSSSAYQVTITIQPALQFEP